MCNAAAVAVPMAIGAGLDIAGNLSQSGSDIKSLKRQAKVSKAMADQKRRSIAEGWEREKADQLVAYHKGGVTAQGTPSDVLTDMAKTGDVASRTAQFEGYEDARERLSAARQRRRKALFDSLSSVSSLGENLMRLDWKS
jgi:hypothetical protein